MTCEELYQRLLLFAQHNLQLIKKLPNTIYNREYSSQLIRSSASPGANYIEAIEASSRKEFCFRLKTSRKETKESIHWLKLIKSANEEYPEIQKETQSLIDEAQQLIKIFTSSILTTEKNQKISK